MKDFEEAPEDFGGKVGLFLIRNTQALDSNIFGLLHQQTTQAGQIISLERLVRGGESALVIYGPNGVLQHLNPTLALLELEDYSKNIGSKVLAWEMKLKSPHPGSIFSDFPKLEDREQVWYQLLLQAQKGKSKDPMDKLFRAQIRVAVLSDDLKRGKLIAEILQQSKGSLSKLPQAFSTRQIMDFYKRRSMIGRGYFKLKADEVVRIWSLPKGIS